MDIKYALMLLLILCCCRCSGFGERPQVPDFSQALTIDIQGGAVRGRRRIVEKHLTRSVAFLSEIVRGKGTTWPFGLLAKSYAEFCVILRSGSEANVTIYQDFAWVEGRFFQLSSSQMEEFNSLVHAILEEQ